MMAMTDSPLIRPANACLFIGKTEFDAQQFCGAFEIDLPATRADVIISYRKNWLDRLAGIERFVVLEKATVESSEVVGDELSYTFCGHGPMKERLRWRGWGILRAIKAWRCA